mmetsp:Transcript_4896/g.13732  ORF Transcript_4896/g.13732 Transcript_4896/m.13732 type:complete len:206 (-) Transcript_4896:2398-3015(-)
MKSSSSSLLPIESTWATVRGRLGAGAGDASRPCGWGELPPPDAGLVVEALRRVADAPLTLRLPVTPLALLGLLGLWEPAGSSSVPPPSSSSLFSSSSMPPSLAEASSDMASPSSAAGRLPFFPAEGVLDGMFPSTCCRGVRGAPPPLCCPSSISSTVGPASGSSDASSPSASWLLASILQEKTKEMPLCHAFCICSSGRESTLWW